MGNLFSNKQQTNQSGTTNSTTSNNLWDNPQLQQFLQGYNQQYGNAGNFNVPVNGYQTGAADQQTGVAAGLQPAQGVANTVAQNGLTPASIQSFMSPYTQNVVDATRADFAKQNANDLSNVNAQAAKQGALTGTGSTVARQLAMESQHRQQDPIIAGLYNQGYGQAANTAAQSAGLQLQGAGTAGSLANSATGANSALGNLGQNIWNSNYQNAQAPYSLYNQGIQGYQGFGNLAGTTASGSSTGVGTTVQTPSTGSVIAGLAGTALSAFSDERVKENIKPIGETFDGQPIYKYNMIGSPQTQIGLMAQDVERHTPEAVGSVHGIKTVNYDRATKGAESKMKPYADGGSVDNGEDDPHHRLIGKMGHAFRAIHDMKKAFGGGAGMPHYDAGGEVPAMEPYGGSQSIPAFMGAGTDTSSAGMPAYLGAQPNAVRPMAMPSMETRPSAPSSGGGGFFSEGVWNGQPATPMQRFGAALTQIGDGPFKGVGAHILAQQSQRLQEMQAQRQAEQLALEARRTALAEGKNPAEIAHLQAQTNLANVGADKEFLLEVEKRKMQYAKELALAQKQQEFDLMDRILKGQPPAAGKYRWAPTAPAEQEAQ